MDRRSFLRRVAATAPVLGLLPGVAFAGDASRLVDSSKDIIPAPSDPAEWPAFRRALAAWRAGIRAELKYDDSLYRRPEFRWAAANYCCGCVMLWDEEFFDPQSGEFTVNAFLDTGEREFGGYDSIVLWHAYPRIGVDDRNQFDFYRDMPGGLGGLRGVVRQCHRRGVRVYIDYNPWDTGTRREPESDMDALVEMVRALEVDGIFLDTLGTESREFRGKLDAARPGVILEGELPVPLDRLADQQASWAQWFDDGQVPGVLRAKWIERRHMQHQVRRWDTDHTGELQAAWMNGSGMMVWENVFGSSVPWSERDRSILRAMLPIQRRFAALFAGEAWTPLVPAKQPGVYASLWEGRGLRLWTLVNRSGERVSGDLLEAAPVPGHRYFDLIAGREIEPGTNGAGVVLPSVIAPRGVACFLSGKTEDCGSGFEPFLRRQSETESRSKAGTEVVSWKTRSMPAPEGRVHRVLPPGMVEIPGAAFEMVTEMRVRECGFYDSAPPGGDGYNFQVRRFSRRVSFTRFAMDAALVTNAEFAEFLEDGGYRPRHRENFLKHWESGRPPKGREEHPVVYVSLEDARAYARWAGKRLPTEEEWQYAGQGRDGRKYPWGDAWERGRCNEGEGGITTPVRQFASGRSPFGCFDMCGNVWEWTESERSDGRTRFCVIRGGSCCAARGSGWYADGGPRPVNFAAKFLLMWPGLDRCGTIGFRCAADLAAAPGGSGPG
ncbi:MAG: formylglycine-generating enzyme family protein [Verrucomicrobiota bacterium]